MSRDEQRRGRPPAGGSSSDQIKAEIEQTRARMDETLDALRERVDPRAMMEVAREQLRSYLRSMRSRATGGRPHEGDGQPRAVARRAGAASWDTIRRHPVSLSLIGVGVAYWFYERKRPRRQIPREAQPVPQRESVGPVFPESAPAPDIAATQAAGARTAAERRAAEEEVERAYSNNPRSGPTPSPNPGHGEQRHGARSSSSSRISAMSEQARSGMHRIAETTRQTGRRASNRMKALAERASDMWQSSSGSSSQPSGPGVRERARQKVEQGSQTMRDHPFAVAAGALGLGMLVGFAIRESRREHQAFGEQARTAQQRMQEAGREAMHRGQEAAEHTWEATKEAAEREGLTPEGLKARAEHVAEEASETARREAERETSSEEQRERSE